MRCKCFDYNITSFTDLWSALPLRDHVNKMYCAGKFLPPHRALQLVGRTTNHFCIPYALAAHILLSDPSATTHQRETNSGHFLSKNLFNDSVIPALVLLLSVVAAMKRQTGRS